MELLSRKVKSQKDEAKKEGEKQRLNYIIAKIDPSITLIESREKPDFELSFHGKTIGAELTSIMLYVSSWGSIEKLFRNVQRKLNTDNPQLKNMFICTVKEDLIVTNKTIKQQEQELYDILSPYIERDSGCVKFNNNDYLINIWFQKSSALPLTLFPVQEYAVICEWFSRENFNKIVCNKSCKIEEYNKKFDENWLLIDVPPENVNKNSVLLDDNISDLINGLCDNRFDKIYLYNLETVYCLQ